MPMSSLVKLCASHSSNATITAPNVGKIIRSLVLLRKIIRFPCILLLYRLTSDGSTLREHLLGSFENRLDVTGRPQQLQCCDCSSLQACSSLSHCACVRASLCACVPLSLSLSLSLSPYSVRASLSLSLSVRACMHVFVFVHVCVCPCVRECAYVCVRVCV